MNWPATTRRQRLLILIILIAGLQVFLAVFLLSRTGPFSARGKSERKELTELQHRVEEARAISAGKDQIFRKLEQSVAELESFSGYAPSVSDRYAWVYEYVSLRARQSQINLDNFENIMPESGSSAVSPDAPYEILISTRCGYSRLVEFLWRLEKNNPLLRIKKVTVFSVPGTLAHRVQIHVQWLPALRIEK